MTRSLLIPVLAVSLAGCSYAFVKPPPTVLRKTYRSTEGCSRSAAWPVVDTVIAGGSLAWSVAAFTQDDLELLVAPALVTTIVGTVFTASAIHGYTSTAECRSRYEERGFPRTGVDEPEPVAPEPTKAEPATPEPAAR